MLFLVHTELKPVLLPLFSGDWQVPQCALTACLCASRRTIKSLPPLSRKGKLGIPFLLSLFSCCISRYKACCSLPSALSRLSMWFSFLHGTMGNESEWKSKLSSGEQWIWLGGKEGPGTIMSCPVQCVLYDLFLKWVPPYFRCAWLSRAQLSFISVLWEKAQFPLLINLIQKQSAG